MNQDMMIQECETDGCPGWKDADECPHNRKFHPNHPACKECEEDALAAMRECEEDALAVMKGEKDNGSK